MNYNISVSQNIKLNINRFNKTDKKIAKYILDYPQEIVNSTISQISDILKLSNATIFRFCKKISFKGFQDLKICLAKELGKDSNNYINQDFEEIGSQKEILKKVFSSCINSISETLDAINTQKIEESIDLILKSKKIIFMGSGGSGIVAQDAHHKFLRTGLNVNSHTEYHLQLMAVSQLSQEDLLIVISHTGSNLNMLEVLKIAKKIGVKTISITSYIKSPISDIVDISLNVISEETKHQFEAFSSRIVQLCLIDALYLSVILKRKNKSKISIEKMREAISSTRM